MFASRLVAAALTVVLLALTSPRPARAEEEQRAPTARDQAWLAPGVLTGGLTLAPGLLLHGAGAFAVGDRRTAKRLMIAEAAGLGVLVGAGAMLVASGASRRTIGVLAPLSILGFSVFALSFLADVYAASTGGRDVGAVRFSPWLESELGYLYVVDPQFRYGSFLHARTDLRAKSLRAGVALWTALDDDNQRVLGELAYRVYGRTPRRDAPDGSYGDLVMGVRHHRFGSDGFSVTTPEWHLTGRLDLGRIGRTLSGSFVEGQVGAGLELYRFDVRGSRLGDNAYGLLLARAGFGLYFGDGVARTGELLGYYDHRHDDFAAGLGVRGIGSGFLGHFGLAGHYFFTRDWGASGLFELGSAVVAGVAVRYRRALEGAP